VPDVVPVPHMLFEEAQKRYWAREPWTYDARFHVPVEHIRWVPVFIAPPRFGASPDLAEEEDGA
jgi:hypothetical protein